MTDEQEDKLLDDATTDHLYAINDFLTAFLADLPAEVKSGGTA